MAEMKELPRIMFEIASVAIPQGVNDVVKAIVNHTGRAVVSFTPVDTGAARSNWIGTQSVPNSGTIPAYAPGSRLGRGEQANKQGAVNQILAAARTLKPGQTFFITNNLDYIEDLDKGKSQQTSPGFVERAVEFGVTGPDIPKILVTRIKKAIKF